MFQLSGFYFIGISPLRSQPHCVARLQSSGVRLRGSGQSSDIQHTGLHPCQCQFEAYLRYRILGAVLGMCDHNMIPGMACLLPTQRFMAPKKHTFFMVLGMRGLKHKVLGAWEGLELLWVGGTAWTWGLETPPN